ncbi:hypothetical protein ABZ897_43335 [Nonomuraea sp. NPDC046802]|uniref:hypothetical protein n=1 Tax=Nonomuraea sp. NPDC046802 TaxID=3154919 RepID=UPI0033D7B955
MPERRAWMPSRVDPMSGSPETLKYGCKPLGVRTVKVSGHGFLSCPGFGADRGESGWHVGLLDVRIVSLADLREIEEDAGEETA